MKSIVVWCIILLTGYGIISCHAPEEVKPDSDPRITPTICFPDTSPNNGKRIEGEYIVIYQSDLHENSLLSSARLPEFSTTILQRNGIASQSLRMTFAGFQKGFACHLTPQQLTTLQKDPAIAYIEPDRVVSIAACLTVVDSSTINWGTRRVGYGDGTGRTVWIIDSGIDTDHEDLNVDTQRSRCFIPDQTSIEDQNGHGTHVAGIIGAKNNTIGTLGIAAGATVVALKVLNQLGEGRISTVLAALGYIRQNARRGDVVNISLVSDVVSQSLDQEVTKIADQGILFAIASGNNAKPASSVSPSRVNHPNVFTVAAMDANDSWASFSNFGSDVVDVAAPGVSILSTYKENQYARMSGTSVATPHMAGILLLDGRNFSTSGLVRNTKEIIPIPHKQ